MTDDITPRELDVRSQVKTLALIAWVLGIGVAIAGLSEIMLPYYLEDQTPVFGWPDVLDVSRTAFIITAAICIGSMILLCCVVRSGRSLTAGGITATLAACTKILMCAVIPSYVASAATEAWIVAEHTDLFETDGSLVLLIAMSVINAGVYALVTTVAVITWAVQGKTARYGQGDRS